MNKTKRCSSPYCIEVDGLKGRVFTPQGTPNMLVYMWCPECIRVSASIQYFAKQTAQMIRTKYAAYRPEELGPREAVILQNFALELIQELGEEEL